MIYNLYTASPTRLYYIVNARTRKLMEFEELMPIKLPINIITIHRNTNINNSFSNKLYQAHVYIK